MKRAIFLILLSLGILLTAGCQKETKPYDSFHSTLVDEKGSYQLLNAKTGMSPDRVIKDSGLKPEKFETKGEPVEILKSKEPILFEELGISFQFYFYFEPELGLTSAEYRASFEEDTSFQAACDTITDYVKTRLPAPDFGSVTALEQKQVTDEDSPDLPQWRSCSKDSGSLSIAYIVPGKFGDYRGIRMNYRSSIPSLSFRPKDWTKSFYDALVAPDGTYRFNGIQPGSTLENITKSHNLDPDKLSWWNDKWAMYRDVVYFPDMDLYFYPEYHFNEDGTISYASYTGRYEMRDELIKASQKLADFIVQRLPSENTYGSVDQLMDAANGKNNSSPSWEHQASDGSSLSISAILGYTEISVRY